MLDDTFSDPTNGDHRRCPVCNARLSLPEAITILNGGGIEITVKVELLDGSIAFIKAGEVNPLTMRVIAPSSAAI